MILRIVYDVKKKKRISRSSIFRETSFYITRTVKRIRYDEFDYIYVSIMLDFTKHCRRILLK